MLESAPYCISTADEGEGGAPSVLCWCAGSDIPPVEPVCCSVDGSVRFMLTVRYDIDDVIACRPGKDASVVLINSGTVEFDQCTFSNNAAGGHGGTINVEQGEERPAPNV